MNKNSDLKGPFVVISGPSGVGKTLFIENTRKSLPQFSNTISYTTRPPRKGEKDGDFYYFISPQKFIEMKERGEFLEWAKVHGVSYATSKKEVERIWQKGKAILKDIDVQGFRSIKKIYPHSIGIFIYPPSIDVLRERILKRGLDSKEQLEKRLSIAAQEMAEGREYDFKIINDTFEEAWQEFQNILKQALKA